MEIDPVCGMGVNTKTTEHWTADDGTRYYFCSSEGRRCSSRGLRRSPEDPGEDV